MADFDALIGRVNTRILENGLSADIELTAPDGTRFADLRGQFLRETSRVNPETGEMIAVNVPVLILQIASLSRVPVAGENWFVKVTFRTEVLNYVMSATRPPEFNRTLGFVRVYLQEAEQI